MSESVNPDSLRGVRNCQEGDIFTNMDNQLNSLRKHSLVVADTGDIDAVARWKPQDATTNPSLLLASAEDPRYRQLVDADMDRMFVNFGCEILKHVAGRVSTEVDARLSFDVDGSIQKALPGSFGSIERASSQTAKISSGNSTP